MAVTTLLSNYPLKIGDVTLIFPTKWDEDYEVIEKVNVSEAGTDIVQVSRAEKLTLSLEYNITGDVLPVFEAYRADPTQVYTVSIWDATANGYITKQMRFRNFKKSLVRKSQELAVPGVWSISFDLIEM